MSSAIDALFASLPCLAFSRWRTGPSYAPRAPHSIAATISDPAGFCLYYRAPNTDYTFDVHTFVVGRDYRNKAVGPRLVELLEERLLESRNYAVIRTETSKLKEDSVGEGFFQSNGFQTIGHIPAFYDADNDYFIYVKSVQADKKRDGA
ncbi:MAG: GNAT family N-acetyltransferase [Planctomycetales bacterium]|nr:GNAT family N-acetyltransferase [Planctomycetales bacterium]